jgi:hypothetical protein
MYKILYSRSGRPEVNRLTFCDPDEKNNWIRTEMEEAERKKAYEGKYDYYRKMIKHTMLTVIRFILNLKAL